MNYLAHARAHLDQPWAVAGTAVPDLLSVADRQARVRPRHLPATGGLDASSAALVAGIAAHFDDDAWFHQTEAFHAVTGEMTRLMREAFSRHARLRASVLAHIGMEMLLDAELCRRDPSLLPAYYRALAAVDPDQAAATVNRFAPRPALRLAAVLRFFRRARFLSSYAHDEGVALRLGQVSRRVGMGRLPGGFVRLVPELRAVVRESADALMERPRERAPAPR